MDVLEVTAALELFEGDAHVPQLPNFNRALEQISPNSRYVKVVLADDWIYPECVERMVTVAEAEPRIGLVGVQGLQNGVKVLWNELTEDTIKCAAHPSWRTRRTIMPRL